MNTYKKNHYYLKEIICDFPALVRGKKYIQIQYPFFVPNTLANANHSTVQFRLRSGRKVQI